MVEADTIPDRLYYATLRDPNGGIVEIVGDFIATNSVSTIEFPNTSKIGAFLFDVREADALGTVF